MVGTRRSGGRGLCSCMGSRFTRSIGKFFPLVCGHFTFEASAPGSSGTTGQLIDSVKHLAPYPHGNLTPI